MRYTEDFIYDALKVRHPKDQWIFTNQLRTSTGYNDVRIIDAFAMHLWPSKKYWKVAYEIKTSKADFMHELSNPLKMAYAYTISNNFYFVIPEKIWDKVRKPMVEFYGENKYGAIPIGVILVNEDGELDEVRQATWTESVSMPEGFIASFLRNVRKQGR